MTERAAPFDESALIAEARERTGLADFGDEGFREPLRVLLVSIEEWKDVTLDVNFPPDPRK